MAKGLRNAALLGAKLNKTSMQEFQLILVCQGV